MFSVPEHRSQKHQQVVSINVILLSGSAPVSEHGVQTPASRQHPCQLAGWMRVPVWDQDANWMNIIWMRRRCARQVVSKREPALCCPDIRPVTSGSLQTSVLRLPDTELE